MKRPCVLWHGALRITSSLFLSKATLPQSPWLPVQSQKYRPRVRLVVFKLLLFAHFHSSNIVFEI